MYILTYTNDEQTGTEVSKHASLEDVRTHIHLELMEDGFEECEPEDIVFHDGEEEVDILFEIAGRYIVTLAA